MYFLQRGGNMSQLRVVEYITLTARLKWLTIRSILAYFHAFVLQIISVLCIDAAFLFLWLLFFTRFPQIAGWRFQDTALLMAIGWLSYSLVALLTGGIFTVARAIQRG